jgi:hypothetical protein
VDGAVVAEDWEGLVSGMLMNPIDLTEFWQPVKSLVWTGTQPNGEAAPDTEFCGDWLDAQPADLVPVGVASQVDTWWTYLEPDVCGSESPLYCVEN